MKNILLLLTLGLGLWTHADEVNADSLVYHNPAKKRFHHPDCIRYRRGKASNPEDFDTLTQKEGFAKGFFYCSRCPVDASYKAAARIAAAKMPDPVHEDFSPRPLVTLGSDGKLDYHSYTDQGDLIMDYSHSGYKASEVPIPDIPAKVTLEPLPDTPEAVRRPVPEPKVDPDAEEGPMVWFNNKKRFHDARCRRAKGSIRKNPEQWTQITYRQGMLSGLDYCSRCPEDAPRVDVNPPDPEDHQPFMAYPKGPDSTARIQAAIDDVGAMEPAENGYRGAVLLSKGTYYLTDTLTVTSGVVLRGEGDGEDGTVLVFHNPKGTGIVLGNKPQPEGEKKNKPESERFRTRIADDYVPVGSDSVTVEDAGGFKVGDAVHVIKTTNEAWLLTIGMHRSQIKMRRPWTPKAYQLATPRRIATIDGNRITFDVPLAQGYVAEHGGGAVVASPQTDEMPSLIGVEHLRVISNYDRKVKSVMRAKGDGAYEADEAQNMSAGIHLKRVANSWVRNCTVMHPSRRSFSNKFSQFITIRDCTSLEPVSIIRGGRRYCFNNSDSSMALFYRNSAENGRHSFVTGSRDAGPIAFVRGTGTSGLSETHSRWATGVLFDNIDKGNGSLAAGNRGRSGSGHGWAGANVVMWNCTANWIKVENPPSPEQNFSLGSIVTGGTGGVNGDGFVYSTGTPLEPESLFEQQLIDRIGREQAEAVLR